MSRRLIIALFLLLPLAAILAGGCAHCPGCHGAGATRIEVRCIELDDEGAPCCPKHAGFAHRSECGTPKKACCEKHAFAGGGKPCCPSEAKGHKVYKKVLKHHMDEGAYGEHRTCFVESCKPKTCKRPDLCWGYCRDGFGERQEVKKAGCGATCKTPCSKTKAKCASSAEKAPCGKTTE